MRSRLLVALEGDDVVFGEAADDFDAGMVDDADLDRRADQLVLNDADRRSSWCPRCEGPRGER